jgi:AcrR family transcriptional regulator
MDGLRERKKRETREAIADAARALFAERGFDAVRVADVARAAGVSEATVFNHFPTKEDLVFRGMEAFEDALVAAIAGRPAAMSVAAAFEAFALGPPYGLLSGDDATLRRLAATSRMIAASPALLARERMVYDQTIDRLAAVLTAQRGARDGDLNPWVEANALIGIHRALVAYVRREVLAGAAGPALVRRVRTRGRRALALLERGLTG